MIKQITIVLLLLNAIRLFAFDFNNDEFALPLNMVQDLVATKKYIYILGDDLSGSKKGPIQAKIARPNKIIDEYGFAKITINDFSLYLFEYNGYVFATNSKNNFISADYKIDNELKQMIINDQNNVTITSSSNLIEKKGEKTIIYSPDNLIYRYLRVEKGISPMLLKNSNPWVPDIRTDQSPKLRFTFTKPISMVSFLNGFIDFDRLKLYKENARPKTAMIIDNTNNVEFPIQFLDGMYYTVFYFEKPTMDFVVKYGSYYKGLKYSDPCVASVIVETNKRERDDYGKGIMNFWKNEIE
jgi:hypothetical protein